jgi:imidazolonepropionase-like amidohydrolase
MNLIFYAILGYAAAPSRPCFAVDGATVLFAEGERPGFVLTDGDRIVVAGERPPTVTPANAAVIYEGRTCPIIAGPGSVVTPGLTAVGTGLGVVEVSLEDATTDQDAGGDEVRAAVAVVDAYHPRSVAVAIARTGGVTSAVVDPMGGLVSGSSGWVDLAGDTQSASVVRRVVAVRGGFGATPSRAGGLAAWGELFDAARRYQANRSAWRSTETLPEGVSFADLDALAPVLAGQVPLVFTANRSSDIEAMLRFAAEQKIRWILDGGAEAWTLAGSLAQANVPVIVDPYVYGPGSFDQLLGRPDNAALLASSGVTVLLSNHETHNVRTLRQLAGNAVRGGMSRADALRAVTSAPAKAFGMSDRGTIAAGARANLVVWTGDPLELSSRATTVMIGGERVPIETRQSALREKYRVVP